MIPVDQGTALQSRVREAWARRRGIQLDSIRSGNTVETVFIESFNGCLRDECLNVHQFASLAEAQAIIETWRCDYNRRRHHSSLEHLPPTEFVAQCHGQLIVEDVVCSGSGLPHYGDQRQSIEFPGPRALVFWGGSEEAVAPVKIFLGTGPASGANAKLCARCAPVGAYVQRGRREQRV
ncbi:integrase core domain-containing protein [Nitrospira defluvii]|uniref:Integrase catalytic domain-containing protein n=1 Tax=Nitrospira defluvii TaxID=330214 RepID=A0ABM8RAI2_9BACT|nr:hypothetical protein NSPZN2_150034 [Nitrospira defluvii]